MSLNRSLRGGCHCGRNVYVVQIPPDATRRAAQVIFDSHPLHRSSQATPLPAYLRVPLRWYHSTTRPFRPDETHAQIHRAYAPPRERHAMRHFCGFCGTPLSYWSERPRAEADFIRLTLGSLAPRDLADLEDLGFLPGSDDEEQEEEEEEGGWVGETETSEGVESEDLDEGDGEDRGEASGGRAESEVTRLGVPSEAAGVAAAVETELSSAKDALFGTVGALPWFDSLVEGSRLGTLRRRKGHGTNPAGTVRVDWEIVEWTEGTEDDTTAGTPRKRKADEVEGGADGAAREGVLT